MSEQLSMNEPVWTDAFLRQFLLGTLSEEERKQIEIRFLTDEAFKTRLTSIEETLIDDYLHDSLPPADLSRFLDTCEKSDAAKYRLSVAELIRNYAAKAKEPQTDRQPKPNSGWLTKLLKSPSYVVPITAALAIVIVLGGIWAMRRFQATDQRKQFENELNALNRGPSVAISPAQLQSISLPPVSLRSAQNQSELVISEDIKVLELRLIWSQIDRPAHYVANLRRVSGSEDFTVQLSSTESGGIVPLKIPAELVAPGLYRITLAAEAGDISEEYQVTFRRTVP
jgi:hypothetical protein